MNAERLSLLNRNLVLATFRLRLHPSSVSGLSTGWTVLQSLYAEKRTLLEKISTIPFSLTGAVHSSTLKRVRTINKSAGLALLARRSSEDSCVDSLVLSESDVSTLGRVRTINKLAGLDILQRRKVRAEAQASS